jgi:ferrochelatase
MGVPDNPSEVKDYLFNIFSDDAMMSLPFQKTMAKIISTLRAKKSTERYNSIGWTPLKKYTDEIVRKLLIKFKDDDISVNAAYTHSKPYIYDEPSDSIIFPLYPQYSISLFGPIKKRIKNPVIMKEWYFEPEFIEVFSKRIKKSLEGLLPQKTALLFLAHGVPVSLKKKGDLYEDEVKESYEIFRKRFSGYKSFLGYIGKVGPQEWSRPYADDLIYLLKGYDNVVGVFLSFPVDNLEVLYDIDTVLKQKAEKAGIKNFLRVPLLNADDDFVEALSIIIRRRL